MKITINTEPTLTEFNSRTGGMFIELCELRVT